MMIISSTIVPACCGKTQTVLTLDRPIDVSVIQAMNDNGYQTLEHFAKAGMVYINHSEMIISGALGQNQLRIFCKQKDCQQATLKLEVALKNIK